MLSRLLQYSGILGLILIPALSTIWVISQYNLDKSLSNNILYWVIFAGIFAYAFYFFINTPLLRKHLTSTFLFAVALCFSGGVQNTIFLGSTLLAVALNVQVLNLFHEDNERVSHFDIGLLIFGIILLEPATFWLLSAQVFLLFFFGRLRYLHHFLRFFLGLLLPLALVVQLALFFDQWNVLFIHASKALDFGLPKLNHQWQYLIFLLILIVFALVNHLSKSTYQKQSKKTQTNLLYLFLLNLVLLLFINLSHELIIMFSAFPLAIIIGRYWQYQNAWWSKDLIIIVFCLAIIGYYFGWNTE